MAGCILGLTDAIIYLLEKLVDWIPPVLLKLDDHLREQWGERWWEGTPVATWAPPP
jgi:hypothetical protein